MAKREEDEFERRRDEVNENDVDDVLDKEPQILRKVSGPLEKFVGDIFTLFSLLKDYKNGTYRDVPWTAIAGIVASLLYIFSPIDLIPDAIPLIGLVDDATVLGICLKSISSILVKYQAYKTLANGVKALTDKVFDVCMDNLLRQIEDWFNLRIKDWRNSFKYTLWLDAAFIVIANLSLFIPHIYGILLLWCAMVVRMSWSGLCCYQCARDFYPNRVIVFRFLRGFLREIWYSRSLSYAIKQTVHHAFCSVYYERTPVAIQKFHSVTSFIEATPSVGEMAERAAEQSCPLLRKYARIMLMLGLFSVVFYGIAIVAIRMYVVYYYADEMSMTQFLLYPLTLLLK
ncbi:MAG: DUF1232 domain-containing protein [Planctomycetaceae bacterium]|nr:DUF1232 domain-containing protein [Planctomycetaceae bacterium]